MGVSVVHWQHTCMRSQNLGYLRIPAPYTNTVLFKAASMEAVVSAAASAAAAAVKN